MNETIRGVRRRSAGEWRELVEAYESRECDKAEFLKQHGLKPGALEYHLDKQRRNAEKFAPIVSVREGTHTEVSLEFRSGLRLTVRG